MTQIANIQGTKLPRRVFQNLKIQTKKNDLKKALAEPLTSENISGELRRRKTEGSIVKQEPMGDMYETIINERFQDLFEQADKLGEGAHSVVYSYMEKKTRKMFAIKVMKDCDVERIRSIKQTYFIMKKLDHPFIDKAVGLFIDETVSKCYLITQLCLYKDLRDYIDSQLSQGKKVSESVAADIIRNLLVCLDYLKQKGVCHRDIKPENILYDPETGDIKLIDFELAKMKKEGEEELEMWTPTGSTFYRAPESFILGHSETIDTWAAGIVSFEMLTGRIPFYSSSLTRVVEDIVKKSIEFDKYLLSPEATKFLRQILQKDPKKRLTPQQALRSSFLLQNRQKGVRIRQNRQKSEHWQNIGDRSCVQEDEVERKDNMEVQSQQVTKKMDNGIKRISF